MEDRDFFDHIYQQWSKTTGAQDRFWMPEEYVDGTGRWKIYAVSLDEKGNQDRKLVASELRDEDADFITAVHGCFADLIRHLGNSLDEADRLDEKLDIEIGRVADLLIEADRYAGELSSLEETIAELRREMQEDNAYFDQIDQENIRLRDELEHSRADTEYWRAR